MILASSFLDKTINFIMQHYAKIEAGIVTSVVRASTEIAETFSGLWLETKTNGSSRKNYAGKGYTYNEARDAFYSPQPFPSWTLKISNGKWEPPVNKPNNGHHYFWNELTLSWILLI